eukprot:TRINITY_DN14604_c0_g1_i5.p1 TRINITY_DN14604_c0_g1~~TRINITY_DN14604_c0_g1_i5.p1  ORF type:complete len:366 (-),score=77.78 TRINITY_DN14604_c0_g1_i5:188-1285(-)
MIFANGNVGDTISEDDVGVYYSRDAGWTWQHVADKAHVYTSANRGAVVLMAEDEEETDSIHYTINEGSSWIECSFGESMEISNVLSDPNTATTSVIVYGNRGDSGVLVTLSFLEKFNLRACQGFDKPSTKSSDYEYWIPTDRKNGDCLLGRTTSYVRRKASAICYNPPTFNYSTTIVAKNCPCTEEDYECDYCYVRSEDGKICVPDTTDELCVKFDPKAIPTPCDGSYTISQGYRKVPGDSCNVDTGLNRLPIVQPCPGSTVLLPPSKTPQSSSSGDGFAYFLIVVIILVVIFAVFRYLAAHSPSVRGHLEIFVPSILLPDLVESASTAQYIPVRLDEDIDQDDAKVLSEEDLSDDKQQSTNRLI